MTAAMAMPGNTAETFLVHFFGAGLADDHYVVEHTKYISASDRLFQQPDRGLDDFICGGFPLKR